jgi:asparagine synthase (glutamine-hydrolysing)
VSGFCAIYASHGSRSACPLLTRMLPALALRGDCIGTWSQGELGLAMTTWNTPSCVRLPYCTPAHDLVLAADMRLDYRSDLLALLCIREAGISDGALLLAAYQAWGPSCVRYLEGDYAFVLWDARQRRLFGARSRTGQRPFVFCRSQEVFMCASEAQVLLASEMIPKLLHRDWLATWLVEGHDSWDATPYVSIEKLPAGHSILVDTQGMQIQAFWKPPSNREPPRSQADYTQQFKALLFDSVRSHIHPLVPSLVDVSGGLDSSSIACILGEFQRQGIRLPAVQGIHVYAPRSSENDDRHLAEEAAQVANLSIISLSSADFEPFRGVFRPRPWADTPAPPILFYTELYDKLFQMAIETPFHAHLRGDFGDQLFDAFPQYLRQLTEEHRYLQLMREVWAWRQTGTVSGRTVLRTSLEPLWKNCTGKMRELHTRIPWVRPEIVERGLERKVTEAERLCRLVPDPLARQLYRSVLLHDDYIAQQNESTRAGLETREPYLDERLIAFLISTAPQDQFRFGRRKFLLREALRGLLPEPIRTRQSKGRVARLLFEGIAHHHQALRQLIITMPEELEPFVDAARFAQALDMAAYGGALPQVPFLSTLALVLWAHRLPWWEGQLPRQEIRHDVPLRKGGDADEPGTGNSQAADGASV